VDLWFKNDDKNNLVNQIILKYKYLDVRIYHEFNLRNIDHIKARSKLTKQIHFITLIAINNVPPCDCKYLTI